eukprot:GHVU01094730.1.p1 GENE.GHVU01094730.1~~GHVU01094730.1.p1  ORF type:complete len:232 (+),score=19.91 GHVU01094730.1:121-816(+)
MPNREKAHDDSLRRAAAQEKRRLAAEGTLYRTTLRWMFWGGVALVILVLVLGFIFLTGPLLIVSYIALGIVACITGGFYWSLEARPANGVIVAALLSTQTVIMAVISSLAAMKMIQVTTQCRLYACYRGQYPHFWCSAVIFVVAAAGAVLAGVGSSVAQKMFESRSVQVVSVVKTHIKVARPKVTDVPPSFDASFVDPETGERSAGGVDMPPLVIGVEDLSDESNGVYLPQ